MRKQRRPAVLITSAVAGAAVVATGFQLRPIARAQELLEATLSERPFPQVQARPERVDFWEARVARKIHRAETWAEATPIPATPSEAAPIEAAPIEAAPIEAAPDVEPQPGTEAVPADDTLPPVSGGDLPSDEQLALLRQCESGSDYTTDTGNGFYGAYQFLVDTWQALGFGGYPHQVPPDVQDQAVRVLYALSGWLPWPGCAAALGWL